MAQVLRIPRGPGCLCLLFGLLVLQPPGAAGGNGDGSGGGNGSGGGSSPPDNQVDPAAAASGRQQSFSQDHTWKCNDTGLDFIPAEQRLMRCLMADYDRAIRPARHATDAVSVSVDMTLTQIFDLNEKEGIIDINAWMTKKWKDPRLVWNPNNYEGAYTLRIPTDRIWLPDVFLLNNAENADSYILDKLALVTHQGDITWMPHARYKAFCKFDLTRFPFDTQKCGLHLGTWSYSKTQVALVIPRNASRKYMWDTREWNVIDYNVRLATFPMTVETYDGKVSIHEEYPYISYNLTIQRSGLFYATILVGPAVILAVLLIFLFQIPPEAGERLTLGGGILVALTVLLTVIDDYMPSEMNSMPILFMYMMFVFVMATIAIIISIWVLNFYHRGISKNKVPNIMRSVFLGKLRKLLCVKGGGYSSVPTEISYTGTSAELRYDQVPPVEHEMDTPLPKSPSMALEKILDEIRIYLKAGVNNRSAPFSMETPMTSHRQMVLDEWYMLAMVIDRLMFWLYCIISIIVTVAILSH